LTVEAGDVLAGVSAPDGTQKIIRSHMDIDGGKHWETCVAGNSVSFEQLHESNSEICPTTIERTNSLAHRSAWESF